MHCNALDGSEPLGFWRVKTNFYWMPSLREALTIIFTLFFSSSLREALTIIFTFTFFSSLLNVMLFFVLVCVSATHIANGCSPNWTRERMWSRYRAQIAVAGQGGQGQGAGQGGRGGRKIGYDKTSTAWKLSGLAKPPGNSVVDIGKISKKGTFPIQRNVSQTVMCAKGKTLKNWMPLQWDTLWLGIFQFKYNM